MDDFTRGDKVKFRLPFQGHFAYGVIVGPSDETDHMVVAVVEKRLRKDKTVHYSVPRKKLIRE